MAALSSSEKEGVAPEVHRVGWFPLQLMIDILFVSKASALVPVNEWQERAYAEQLFRMDAPES